MGWTEEQQELAIKLYLEDGLSCAIIAKRLADGKSRNAVIGMLHREGVRDRRRMEGHFR